MKRSLNIFGIILLLLGLLWTLQGVGLVGGSFMTGQTQWVVIGLITMLIGAVVMAWANRRRTPAP